MSICFAVFPGATLDNLQQCIFNCLGSQKLFASVPSRPSHHASVGALASEHGSVSALELLRHISWDLPLGGEMDNRSLPPPFLWFAFLWHIREDRGVLSTKRNSWAQGSWSRKPLGSNWDSAFLEFYGFEQITVAFVAFLSSSEYRR